MNNANKNDSGACRTYCLDARTAIAHFPGIGRYVANLAQALAPLLHDHERLILLRDPSRPRLFAPFAGTDDRVRVVDLDVSPFSPRQQWAVPRLLRRLGVDLYHSPYTLLPYFRSVPTVLTVHDLIPLLFPGASTAKARLFFAGALRLAMRSADAVVAVSRHTCDDLRQRYDGSRIEVIPEAAAPHFAPADAGAVADLCARLRLPPCYALYLGSTKPHKNLARLLEAWRSGAMPWPLVVAGVRPENAPKLPEARAMPENVRCIGPLEDSDLPPLYSGASLFVFPSLYEGFGLPVLEAMACGAPVLCSDRASLPEVGGGAAAYVNPEDSGAIAAAVRELAASPERLASMRAAGLRRAALFSWEHTAAQTLALYRELATSRTASLYKENVSSPCTT